MKLSDAIARGAGILRTTGPGQPLGPVFVGPSVIGSSTPRDTIVNDALTAAQIGLLGRLPTNEEYLAFYWANPWGATHSTQLGYWLRLTESHKYRWADVINKLKAYGA